MSLKRAYVYVAGGEVVPVDPNPEPDIPCCSICTEEMLYETIRDAPLYTLPECNHTFHVGCLFTWLRSSRRCPLCNDDLEVPLPIEIYDPVMEAEAEAEEAEEEAAPVRRRPRWETRFRSRTLKRTNKKAFHPDLQDLIARYYDIKQTQKENAQCVRRAVRSERELARQIGQFGGW